MSCSPMLTDGDSRLSGLQELSLLPYEAMRMLGPAAATAETRMAKTKFVYCIEGERVDLIVV